MLRRGTRKRVLRELEVTGFSDYGVWGWGVGDGGWGRAGGQVRESWNERMNERTNECFYILFTRVIE